MATTQQTEAIKLIGDFAKWIATVETAAIAAIGVLVRGGSPAGITAGAFGVAVTFFVVSIVAAGLVLLSLPAAVQDIADHEKVWDRIVTAGRIRPLLRNVVAFQLLAFVAGITAFGVGVLALLCAHQ